MNKKNIIILILILLVAIAIGVIVGVNKYTSERKNRSLLFEAPIKARNYV